MPAKGEFLAARANARLTSLGCTLPDGMFVCPTCLNLRRSDQANESHYPARSAPATARRTEIQCSRCNNLVGALYEKAAADFLHHIRQVTVARPGGGGPAFRLPATLRGSDGGVTIQLKSRHARKRRDHPKSLESQFERAASADTPRRIAVSIATPTDEAAKRALLAWSFLAFFYYAGYEYAASPGAEVARRLILDPSSPLPGGIYYQKGEVSMPLAAPAPVLLACADDDDGPPTEAISVGVAWGPLVISLPFANDHTDRPWHRLAQLLVIDELRSVRAYRLRPMSEAFRRELPHGFGVNDGTRRWEVTPPLPPLQIEALAQGVSPRRIELPTGVKWDAPMRVEHEFEVVEADIGWPTGWQPPEAAVEAHEIVPRQAGPVKPIVPRPDESRSAYWTQRHLALGGGHLPRLVARLLAELPGVPSPIPEPLPLSMEDAPEGRIATLHLRPEDLRAFGPSPAQAVGALLAKVENEFAPRRA